MRGGDVHRNGIRWSATTRIERNKTRRQTRKGPMDWARLHSDKHIRLVEAGIVNILNHTVREKVSGEGRVGSALVCGTVEESRTRSDKVGQCRMEPERT